MCTHEDATLSKGSLHCSRFRLVCDEMLDEPAEKALGTWPIKIDDDNISSVYQTNCRPL